MLLLHIMPKKTQMKWDYRMFTHENNKSTSTEKHMFAKPV